MCIRDRSGGPTAAINSSLAGVYRTAKDRGAKKVYGMLHGIQGLMQEKYIDLSDHIKTELDAELLKSCLLYTSSGRGQSGTIRDISVDQDVKSVC